MQIIMLKESGQLKFTIILNLLLIRDSNIREQQLLALFTQKQEKECMQEQHSQSYRMQQIKLILMFGKQLTNPNSVIINGKQLEQIQVKHLL
jgi:hypothetical protein